MITSVPLAERMRPKTLNEYVGKQIIKIKYFLKNLYMKQILLFTFIFSTYVGFAQLQNSQLTLKPSATKGKDSHIYSINPNFNYGNYVNLLTNTWTNSGVLGNIRFFVEFDLSNLPANAIIDSAYLKLYYDSTNTINYQTHFGSNDMEVKRVSSPWVENTVTWNNQPATSNVNMLVVPPFTSNTQNYEINVSTLLNDMVSTTNHGFMVKMQDEINYYKASIFASSDHPDTTLYPELMISYRAATGIKSSGNDLSNQLSIYPNPSNGVFNFNFSNNHKLSEFEIELTNVLGKAQTLLPPSVGSQIDLSSLSRGVYFIKLINKTEEVYLKKIVLF